jgi:hypothetical protein
MRSSWLLLWVIAGCGSVKNQPEADAFTCTANEFLSCDGTVARSCNGAGEGTTTQDCGAAGCNADAKRCNQCAPNTASCGNNALDHCGPDGMPASQDTCAIGCVDAPAAHCAYLEPRYLPDVCDAPATMPALTISVSATFDTALDTNCNGGVVTQTGGPPICVVRYGAITIEASRTLSIVGPRVLALVADSSVSIGGVLDVSATTTINGPGGGAASGGAAGSTSGGGGAGFRTAGGAGGNATVDGGAANGGAASTEPSLLTALVGGTRPANSIFALSAISGGAGGAATLIACRGSVTVAGVIDAGGGGGRAGFDSVAGAQISFLAGAGGGAGGNVVLQGVAITVTGQVFANGGGGGAGSNTNDMAGIAGTDGLRSTSSAVGGSSTAGEGRGGNGGAAGIAPGVGGRPTAGSPGGGGGSIGFFQSYTPMGVIPMLTPSAASPGFSPNRIIQTR